MNKTKSPEILPVEERLIGVPVLGRENKLFSKYISGGRSGRPDTRFEIYGYPMRIGKFAFTFQSIREGRQLSYLAVYLDCYEAIRMMKMLAEKDLPAKLIGDRYYWVSDRMGSVTKVGPEFRSLKVSGSTAHPGEYYLLADRCKGVESEKGLWNPTREKGADGKPEGYRSYGVPMSPKEAFAAYKAMDTALYGMSAAQYAFAMLQDSVVRQTLGMGMADQPTMNPETGEIIERDPVQKHVAPPQAQPAAPTETAKETTVSAGSSDSEDDDMIDYNDLPF